MRNGNSLGHAFRTSGLHCSRLRSNQKKIGDRMISTYSMVLLDSLFQFYQLTPYLNHGGKVHRLQ